MSFLQQSLFFWLDSFRCIFITNWNILFQIVGNERCDHGEYGETAKTKKKKIRKKNNEVDG